MTGRDETGWNSDAKPAVAFNFAPTRSDSFAEELLASASPRFLTTDGYSAYNKVTKSEDGANEVIGSARCWAHARRKFFEVWTATQSKVAKRVCDHISAMYKVESICKGKAPEERSAARKEQSLQFVNAIHKLLVEHQHHAEGKLKGAITYTLKAFDALRCFIFDERLEIDNNFIERAIRPIALTKKNSLFAGNDEAAQVWAIYTTLIETARLNKINPRRYLNWVVEEIERQWGEEVDYSLLMPWHCPVGHIEP